MAPGFQTFVSCQQQLVPNATPLAHYPHFHRRSVLAWVSHTRPHSFSPGETQRQTYLQFRTEWPNLEIYLGSVSVVCATGFIGWLNWVSPSRPSKYLDLNYTQSKDLIPTLHTSRFRPRAGRLFTIQTQLMNGILIELSLQHPFFFTWTTSQETAP